jgi:POT family proton-dependent oligopeptide transporter
MATTDDRQEDTQSATGEVPNTHPKGLYFIFWGEFAERSSYYGMRAILFLYLTKVIHFSDTFATPVYSGFKMACYFLPLLGGIIADRWLGRYWTIVAFSVPYILGHFVLGVPNELALFAALALLAGGSGVIKPNISPLLGETYTHKRPGNTLLLDSAFRLFYLSINIGALLSQLLMPLLRDQFGYAIAFQFPAWLMVGSLAAFAAGKRHYYLAEIARPTPEEQERQWQGMVDLFKIEPIAAVFSFINPEASAWRTLARLLGIFGLIVFFWVGYEHNDTLWIAFTRDYVDLTIPGTSRQIAPDQLQFINALFVIILVPAFNILFAKIDPQSKVFTPMRKIFIGFLLTAAAVGTVSLAGYAWGGHAEAGSIEKVVDGQTTLVPGLVATEKVSMLWMVVAYIVLTFGEVLLYPTALQLAFTAAPKSMKGFVTAVFLLTNTLGNFINTFWTTTYGGSFNDKPEDRGSLAPGRFFALTALMAVGAGLAFIYVGRRFQRENEFEANGGVA